MITIEEFDEIVERREYLYFFDYNINQYFFIIKYNDGFIVVDQDNDCSEEFETLGECYEYIVYYSCDEFEANATYDVGKFRYYHMENEKC